MIKKIFFILFLFLLPNSTFAVNIGNLVGFSSGILRLKTEENYLTNSNSKDSNIYFNLFYKYNWDIKKILIGVEFFYDYLNVKNFIYNNSVNIEYRYGNTLNLGYNITDKFSFYGIIGYGIIKYKAFYDTNNYYDKDNNFKFETLYGIGINYDVSISWKIGLEYNVQNLNIRLQGEDIEHILKNKLEAIKFSIIYKF